MDFPANLLYTRDHEWVLIEGSIATIGVTAYATDQLGDIVYVDIATLGQTLHAHETFGTVEAVKTVADLFMPIDGRVDEVNSLLANAPETVNSDPYGDGWMVRLEVKSDVDTSHLMPVDAYKASIGQ